MNAILSYNVIYVYKSRVRFSLAVRASQEADGIWR
jgi:hypothetical protein